MTFSAESSSGSLGNAHLEVVYFTQNSRKHIGPETLFHVHNQFITRNSIFNFLKAKTLIALQDEETHQANL